MKDFKSKEYDPNGQLSRKEIEWAVYAGKIPFVSCKIRAFKVKGFDCPTLLLGKVGNKKLLVYVRVTRNIKEEKNVGKMPAALLNVAKELKAMPFIVRINITRKEGYTYFKYWGISTIIRKIKSDIDAWNKILLKGKSIEYYLKLNGNKINHLEFDYSSLFVDRANITIEHIDFIQLFGSTKYSDEYFIFTCGCGIPECAGIYRGVIVVHDDSKILWKIFFKDDTYKIYIFNKAQYINEIVTKIKNFAAENKAGTETEYDLGIYTGSYVSYINRSLEKIHDIKPNLGYSCTVSTREEM